MGRLIKIAGILLLPFALASCVLTPGKFASTLRVDADGRFSFTYLGEVFAVDLDEAGKMSSALGSAKSDDKSGDKADAADKAASDAKDAAAHRAEADTKNRAMAEALSKEAGFRKVTYTGDGRFEIDYAIDGRLDHSFVFPYNLDAEAVFPFIAVERRQGGLIRVKAPGFANDNSQKSASLGSDASKLDGVFTLDTNATIVSQNNEEGAKPRPGGRQVITWKATPLSKDAPTAVLRLK